MISLHRQHEGRAVAAFLHMADQRDSGNTPKASTPRRPCERMR
jgi:hypothetical protein